MAVTCEVPQIAEHHRNEALCAAHFKIAASQNFVRDLLRHIAPEYVLKKTLTAAFCHRVCTVRTESTQKHRQDRRNHRKHFPGPQSNNTNGEIRDDSHNQQ